MEIPTTTVAIKLRASGAAMRAAAVLALTIAAAPALGQADNGARLRGQLVALLLALL
jgi:hypothetical protein